MDEGVVEGGEDACNAEDELACNPKSVACAGTCKCDKCSGIADGPSLTCGPREMFSVAPRSTFFLGAMADIGLLSQRLSGLRVVLNFSEANSVCGIHGRGKMNAKTDSARASQPRLRFFLLSFCLSSHHLSTYAANSSPCLRTFRAPVLSGLSSKQPFLQ